MGFADQVQAVLNSLSEIRGCTACGTSIRFGDYDCPHCGLDLEDHLWDWASNLVKLLNSKSDTCIK